MIVKPSPGHDQRPPLTQRPLPLSLPLLHSGPSPRSSPRSLTAPVSAPRFSARARVSSSSSSSSSASLGRPLAPSATTPSFRRRDDCRAGQGDDDDDDDDDDDGKEGKNSKREPSSLPSSASHAPTSASAAAAEARPLPLSPHFSHPASAPGHDLTATATTTTTTRIPSPSSSTSPPSASSTSAPADDGTTASMAPQTGDHATLGHPFSYEGRTSVTISPSPRRRQQQQQQQQQQHQDYHHHEQLQQQPQQQQQHHHQELQQQPQKQQQQQPSPPADDPPVSASAGCLGSVSSPQPLVTRLRDLAHMQVLASADLLGEGGSGGARYDISGMPIGDIIKMVAALLTKITAANDLQHDALQRNATQQQQQTSRSKQDKDGPEEAKAMNPLNHSVLAFHGKNVPAITILNYLSRIHKYCPTTYEVFLSLLVYFDRMTERVNELVLKSDEARRKLALSKTTPSLSQPDAPMADGAAADDGNADDADDDDDGGEKKSRRESISETVVREVVLDDEDDVDGRPRRQLLFDNTSDLADDEEEHEIEDGDGDDDKTAVSSSGSSNPTGGRIIFVPDVMRASASGPTTFFVVDSFNIHRLVIAGVTCASKFFSDVFYTNSRYAKVGGLPLAELNHLEIQFLVLNDFRLAVSVEDLEAYATMLVDFYAREMTAALSPAAAAPALTSGPGYDDAKPAPGLRF